MVKRSREKKQQEETEKQKHVIVTESNLFNILLQKMVEICPANLTVKADGAADLPARNLPQCKEFHATPISSLPDYFWS